MNLLMRYAALRGHDVRFIFADCQDFVDPGFDFHRDEFSPERKVQWDDLYPHEYFDRPPYDGILISRAIVGNETRHGKYSTAQMQRFLRDGASAFIRYDPRTHDGMLIGDCGAFSYVKSPEPPFSVSEIVDYYGDCGFTHGVSIDHVILSYNEQYDGPILFSDAVPAEWLRRFDLTLRLAEQFLLRHDKAEALFHPIGVAQGWSPGSYAEAVRQLVKMGYDYVAIGGLVPLKSGQIHNILAAVRDAAPPPVRLHLFGFSKADQIGQFVKYEIDSFDSTSPMLRAFKDDKSNYLGSERWYTAIRVPHADENRRFKRDILAGVKEAKQLRQQETAALDALRRYGNGQGAVQETVEAVAEYGREFGSYVPVEAYRQTLLDRPWAMCPCRICREHGIEVIIFRGSNRNRRRGFHNLWAYYQKLQALQSGKGTEVHAI